MDYPFLFKSIQYPIKCNPIYINHNGFKVWL